MVLTTVSIGFISELLQSIRRISTAEAYQKYLKSAGIHLASPQHASARITHDQLVRLYQVAAVDTGDEMMGLWSRPARSGALKYICKAVIDADLIRTAIYRFCQFWNLVLDDYALALECIGGSLVVRLLPREGGSPGVNRFGHMLMLKLTHGIASWLIGRELPVRRVDFAFSKSPFADDYPLLFPSPIRFDCRCSAIVFESSIGDLRVDRHPRDVQAFLKRAPRDWIFTAFKEHAVQLKVRQFLFAGDQVDRTLSDVARQLNMSPRTLLRRLSNEQLSFQAIKDGLRRDIAIRDLIYTKKSFDDIACALGFSSVAVFHRAFKNWTGLTPGHYRRQVTAAHGPKV